MLVTSLKTSTEAVTSLSFLPSEFRFSNYYTAWISSNFTAQFINSFIVASCVTVLQVVTSAMSGYALARIDFKGKNTLLMVLLATLIIPFQVLAVPVFAILKNIGAVNTYTGLILPSAANAFGIFLFKQFFEKIPRELEEAAFIDGVSRWNVLWKIIVPLSGPPMVTLAIFTFVAEWNDLFKPLILTSSSDMRTVQMGLGVFQEQFMTDYPLLMAAVTFVTIPGIVLFLMAQKRFIQGIAGTGIKG
ncbi:MAG: carbohydrate ABC transporter permease [Oligoflexia bacterium]|nr:carbohydrate ABC transporter permease [Oligoflexia bacterium]